MSYATQIHDSRDLKAVNSPKAPYSTHLKVADINMGRQPAQTEVLYPSLL